MLLSFEFLSLYFIWSTIPKTQHTEQNDGENRFRLLKNFYQADASARTCPINDEGSVLETIRSTSMFIRATRLLKSECCVNRIIGTFGISFFNSRAASRPFITGMDRSRMIRSGRW